MLLSNLSLGVHTLRSVLHVRQSIDDGFHITQPGTYELVLNLTVQAPPTATATPVLSEAVASKPADVVGIWRMRFVPLGGWAYIQYRADGTWVIAKTVEQLKTSPAMAGTFRLDGAKFITDDSDCGLGTYEVRVKKSNSKPVELVFAPINDSCRARVSGLGRGMTWVEP